MDEKNNVRQLLNSELIEQTFGNYYIEVLESKSNHRVSDLYSVDNGTKITRSFAVVKFANGVDAFVPEAHQEVLNGGSMGQVLMHHGWVIEKCHSFMDEVPADEKYALVYSLMGDMPPCPLALHVYMFAIIKDQVRHPYCTVAEVHHPDHLRLEDLQHIYGHTHYEQRLANEDEMIALVLKKMQSVCGSPNDCLVTC